MKVKLKAFESITLISAGPVIRTAAVVVLFCIALPLQAQPRKLVVAAASDLKFALDSVVADFQLRQRDIAIVTTYGSSGKFFEQISHGAPYDIFFSADRVYPDRLVQSGKSGAAPQVYGKGRLAIWSRKADVSRGFQSLQQKSVNKISIANPVHAPYGQRAVEALKSAGLYDEVKPRLVFGENISQAAQFITTGAADAGIIALSLALSPAMADGHYYLVPADMHTPLEQAVVILKRAADNNDARIFQDFVLGDRAKAILAYFGFEQTR